MTHRKLGTITLLCGLVAGWATPPLLADNWPQLQHDAARTGRTTDSVAPPYLARWIWLGPTQTLYNSSSSTSFPQGQMPTSVNFTIADTVQPVLYGTRLFVGTMDGGAYGINAADGTTAWSATLNAGTIATAAVSTDGTVVIFTTLSGMVHGLYTSNGQAAWTAYQSPGTITGAPCIVGTDVYFADHQGYVTSLNATSGAFRWQRRILQGGRGMPIHGGLAADSNTIYVGAENMYFYALNTSDGVIRNTSARLRGQTFRMLFPMVYNSKVYASTVTTPIIGSEYIGESNTGSNLMADGTSQSNEESNIRRWLTGDTNGGRWPDASPDWKHLYALNTSNLTEAFAIGAGPYDGCGLPGYAPVVDNSNRVLTYFKTKYPYLTKNGGTFGTNYSIDISAVDQANGNRIVINNGTLANPWPWETDNLFGLSVGGSYLWMRQNFRGTQNINLANSSNRRVQVQIRVRDGGDFSGYDIKYQESTPECATSQESVTGRAAPIIAGTRVYLTETYCVTAIEHY